VSGDKFAKQQAGAPLQIPAATWNAMIDAARAHADQQHNQNVQSDHWFRSGDLIKVRNQSGEDIDRFGILALSSPIIDPADKLREFKNQVAVDGVLPEEEHAGQFCILLDPLKDGKIGRGWVSGVCPVQVNVEEDWHRYADISPESTTELKSKPDGGAEILWCESGTGSKWAVVRLSNAHRTHYLAKVPHGGIPGRVGTRTGSAECELYTVDDAGEIQPVTRPEGETVTVVVRHHGQQPVRRPINPDDPQYLGVTFDGHHSWLLDPPKQTLLCKPRKRLRAKSWGMARELRFVGGKWRPAGAMVSVYNVCDYALLPTQQIVCHFHEDTTSYLTIGCRCCDGSSSSSSSSDSSSSSSGSSSSSSSSSGSSSSSSSSGSSKSSSSSSSGSGSSSSDSSSGSSSGSSSSSSSDSSSSDSSSESKSSKSSSESQSSSSESKSQSSSSGSDSSSTSSGSSSSESESDSSQSISESQSESSQSESQSSESASSESESSVSESSESTSSESGSSRSVSSGSPSTSSSDSRSLSGSESESAGTGSSSSGSGSGSSGSGSGSSSDSTSHSRSISESHSLPSGSGSKPSVGSGSGSSSGCFSTWIWSCGWELISSNCNEPLIPTEIGPFDGATLEVLG
jgi:hypothetical protein